MFARWTMQKRANCIFNGQLVAPSITTVKQHKCRSWSSKLRPAIRHGVFSIDHQRWFAVGLVGDDLNNRLRDSTAAAASLPTVGEEIELDTSMDNGAESTSSTAMREAALRAPGYAPLQARVPGDIVADHASG